jgi:hypothetical protein
MSNLSDEHIPGMTELNLKGDSNPKDVPVFNCIVYVSNEAGGGVQARVANLSGIACTATSEREALSKTVAAFKQRMVDLTQSGAPIPWIEPPSPMAPNERKRLIAVHL